tara:strand:+ start:13563 stop:14795 length:1233 start_codon:yes stop_codon:yes gene_type:complete
MKKLLITLILMVVSFSIVGQSNEVKETPKNNLFKNIYDKIFKYSTVYVAGDISTPYETKYPDYFIRTNPDDLYAVPDVVDETIYHPADYRLGFGIRKVARYDHEIKKNYIDGNENMIGLSAPSGPLKGWEFLIHYEKERERSEEFTNHRYFLRHSGKWHIGKVEYRSRGNVDFEYLSAELRFKVDITKNLHVSLGAIYRTHQKAYGYNPIELWLNQNTEYYNEDTQQMETLVVNHWWELGYLYGYNDELTRYINMERNNYFYDWIWRDKDDNIVAYGDRDFRDRIYGQLMNRYNNEQWALLDEFGEIAPIIGFNFYKYKRQFWTHIYGNWILPYHKYVQGDEQFSYLYRSAWGKGGVKKGSKGEQWSDWNAGLIFGWKIGKRAGIFLEAEYIKFWESEIYNGNIGINYRL